jgi:hypothetical protein
MQATDAVQWAMPGASGPEDLDEVPLDQGVIQESKAWFDLDVAEAVRDWILDPASNYGVLVKGSCSDTVIYEFLTSEYGLQEYRPRLVVSYIEATITPTPTITRTPTDTRTPTATSPATSTGTPTTAPSPSQTPSTVFHHCYLPLVMKLQP